eukprot:gene17534-biopygen3863
MAVLKRILPGVAGEVAKLVNTVTREGRWPEKWKTADVRVIWKGKGSKAEPKCYRPISILPAISRLVERMLERQLREHVQKLLPEQQHGFTAKHSCTTALTVITRHIANARAAVGGAQAVMVTSLDAASAFDTVDHTLLLKKLENVCGVRGSALELLKSYLTGRKQRVRMSGDRTSNIEKTGPFGVPQGSVLAPLLYAILERGAEPARGIGKSGFFEPGIPLVSVVRTPLRALLKRRKRRCNAPALRFPTRHLAAWGQGPAGLGRPRWPAKKSRKSSNQTREDPEPNWCRSPALSTTVGGGVSGAGSCWHSAPSCIRLFRTCVCSSARWYLDTGNLYVSRSQGAAGVKCCLFFSPFLQVHCCALAAQCSVLGWFLRQSLRMADPIYSLSQAQLFLPFRPPLRFPGCHSRCHTRFDVLWKRMAFYPFDHDGASLPIVKSRINLAPQICICDGFCTCWVADPSTGPPFVPPHRSTSLGVHAVSAYLHWPLFGLEHVEHCAQFSSLACLLPRHFGANILLVAFAVKDPCTSSCGPSVCARPAIGCGHKAKEGDQNSWRPAGSQVELGATQCGGGYKGQRCRI